MEDPDAPRSRAPLLLALALAGPTGAEPPAQSGPRPASDRGVEVRHRTVDVGGVRIFYREAGAPDARGAPTVLLLHGFPSSSHMFRNLIPRLARSHHVVAPDYPGFGASDFPPADTFTYSFEHLAEVVGAFTETLGLERYALYLQDYGAPVGLRLALRDPSKVKALIVQNGNAYEEGLSAEWAPLEAHWRAPTAESREALRGWLTRAGVEQQYTAGLDAAEIERVSPDTWTLDWARLARPGNVDVQLDLFADYRTNVALYPRFQEYFRAHRPPTLVVWGARDPFFTVAGAEAYRRDLPDAEIHVLPRAGHFALETHLEDVASRMEEFLVRLE
jgi:pimeloyl-ACP methyl ester carboxylesterase